MKIKTKYFIEYVDYLEEKNTEEELNDQEILDLFTHQKLEVESEKEEDDSMKIPKITHKEALNAIELLGQYLVQQDLTDVIRTEHDTALLKLQKEIRKLQNASYKQTNIESYVK